MKILYRDFGAARYRTIDERMANPSPLSPHSQVFSPLDMLTEAVACKRHQATPENALSLNWYVKMNIDSARDHKAWESIKVPAGEKLELYKHLPGWNRLLDVGVLVFGASHAMDTDIEIVKFADPDTAVHTIQTGINLSIPDDFAADITVNGEGDEGFATVGDYIKRSDSYLLKVTITPPFTDEDGNGVFVKGLNTGCEERACLKLVVHAHLRNMCFSDSIVGCKLENYGCDFTHEAPPNDCAPTTPAAPDVIMPVITVVPDQIGTVDTEITPLALAASEPISLWEATPLPAGLSINPDTGVISGTPTGTGTTTVVVTATDEAGNVSATVSFDWVVS